jgi:hypothetical protein
MANRDLLKEAIADAKAVKETAIANAKAALEEAFAPRMKEMLSAKLAEMDAMDEAEEMDEMKKKEVEETYSMDEADYMDEADTMDEAEEMKEAEKMDEVDLDELLRELESMDEDEMYETETMDEAKKEDKKKKSLEEEVEEALGTINDPDTPTAHGNVAEEEDVTVSDDEEIDLENMSEDDLKSFIEDVIADMVSAGELEAGEGAEDAGEDTGKEIKVSDEEDVNLDELMYEIKKDKADKEKETKKKMEEMKKELDEAYSALATIKSELNEVNLFNAKLLYTNKIFRTKNLTESQKVKVLASFDKATSVKEAKLVYETLSEGFNEKKAPVNESFPFGSASKPAGVVKERKPIMEVNDQFARWQKLAGIK